MADKSENPEVQDTENLSTPQAGDLGQQLKRCREKAGLDIEQAASEMRLSPHLLRSLEEEDFQTLPEPPYVRGYLRSYARLAESNPNTLIETYEVLRGAGDDYKTQFTPLKSRQYNTKSRVSPFTAKLIGLLVLIAILGGLSMIPDVRTWASGVWTSFSEKVEDTDTATTDNSEEDEKTTEAASTSTAISIPSLQNTATEQGADTADNTVATASDDDEKLSGTIQRTTDDDATTDSETASETADANATDTSETSETSASDETAVENGEDAADQVTTANDAEASAEDNAAATMDSTTKETDNTSENSENSEASDTITEDTSETNESSASSGADAATTDNDETPEETAATDDGVDTSKQPIDGDVTVRMEFEQEVWLQIRNNEDKSIFETLKSSGQQELKARTPLKFKVGNAPGVKIYLNGVLFDQKPHTRGNVANFEVK